MANVLVTGGAGYIGGALVDLLLGTEHSVRVYDALLYEDGYRKPVDFVFGDVRDREQLRPHLEWADAVVWLAAIVGDGACALNPEVSVTVNQDTVRWLADNFDGRIIFMSTCSVYGAGDGVLDESSPTDPLSVYAVTKLEAEQHLADKNAIIFRLGTLFGVGDLFSRVRLDLVVNTMTVKAHQLGRITVYGGDQYRPLLGVHDAARAVCDNLSTGITGVFNLHHENVRIIDLAGQVRAHFPGLIVSQTDRKFEDLRNDRVSSDKARERLGVDTRDTIDEGIEGIKSLLDSGRLTDIDNPRYNNHRYLSMYNTHLQV